MLSENQLKRYSRHLILPEIGVQGQEKLLESKVLVIGAGGLGAPVLQYLAAAGVGSIGIVDYDTVEESNLQRQVLFGTSSVGVRKSEASAKRIADLNPSIQITQYPEHLNSSNALQILGKYDLIIDGTDNFPTRYLVNDACVILGKPFIYGSIYRFEGQVSVFNLKAGEERPPNYRDLFPEPPPPNMVPSCAEGGVVGALPGIIGSIQASEAIKVITGSGKPLSGRLFILDALTMDTRIIKFPTDGNQKKIDTLIDYEEFCGTSPNMMAKVKEITVKELNELRQNGNEYQLIDVREPFETDIATIGGDLIPQGTVQDNVEKFDPQKQVIVYCRSGKRSADVIRLMEKKHGLNNLYNLKGGILAWADEIDPTIQKY